MRAPAIAGLLVLLAFAACSEGNDSNEQAAGGSAGSSGKGGSGGKSATGGKSGSGGGSTSDGGEPASSGGEPALGTGGGSAGEANGGSGADVGGADGSPGGAPTKGEGGSGPGSVDERCGPCAKGQTCIYQVGGPGPSQEYICATEEPCLSPVACACIIDQGECSFVPEEPNVEPSGICVCDNGLE